MGMGAQRAQAQPYDGESDLDQADWDTLPPSNDYVGTDAWHIAEPEERPARVKTLRSVLIGLAALWGAASLWVLVRDPGALSIAGLMQWVATLSVPLVLLGIAWLILGQTPRKETERFTRAVAAMRGESSALESILSIVATRLEENHARLTNEAAKLMSLGDEASDRLGRVAHYLSKESVKIDERSVALEAAAENARVDIGVLLHDLPRAEEQARAVAEAMKDAGLSAHAQAGALEGQLSALVARGREADEVVGSAAQRLGAELARIDSSSGSAAERMDEAAASMTASVDAVMNRAADAVAAARSGIEAQGATMLAMIEQSRAGFDKAGEESTRNLGQRLDQIGGKIETLAGQLAAQDAASHALVSGLARELSELDERFAGLSGNTAAQSQQLGGSIETVRSNVQELSLELKASQDRAAQLIERAQDMAQALGAVSQQLDGSVPEALSRVEEQAERTRALTSSIAPQVEAIQGSAAGAATSLSQAEASVARQQEALAGMLAQIAQGVSGAEEQLRALSAAAAEADGAATRIVADTGPELIEALVRVREAANQAAERAREAIAAVIPQSAAALAEASRVAVGDAISGTVQDQMAELGPVAEQAVEAARRASERLTRQMLTIAETTAQVESRIEDARSERETKESESFSRRVTLLIESLNSTSIDVTKILSNDVTDMAWAAYLKGDRGVFTRRAVRLIDNAEAREIVQHYESEPDFRDQVNRYIHDFEAMLRRILADKDSSALGVTILSSDMGKLYVALAQAIERLR